VFHVGLRKEAHDRLRGLVGSSHPSESYLREMRDKARDAQDDEAYAMWSRLLWRLYVKERYTRTRTR
jgi:hypothetical protein